MIIKLYAIIVYNYCTQLLYLLYMKKVLANVFNEFAELLFLLQKLFTEYNPERERRGVRGPV